MKITQFITTTAILLLLTWLWSQGMSTATNATDEAMLALDSFAMAESDLKRDVLSARAGVLRDYDPLVRELEALRTSIDRLRTAEAGDMPILAALDRLANTVALQEQLTEQFKSRNDLLQSSLAYFDVFSGRLESTDQGQLLFRRVSDLSAALLHFTLDTSPAATAHVDDRLEKIPVGGLSANESATIAPLLYHARMLRKMLPATDETVKSLLAVPEDRDAGTIRVLVQASTVAAKKSAEVYRYTLYAVSLCLVGYLVCQGRRLQSRALHMERRSAIERVIAGISTRFINSRPHEIAAHVELALAELAACMGADRAYFVVENNPTNPHKWCRAQVSFPPNWPETAPIVASGFGTNSRGVVKVHDVDRLQLSSSAAALRAANIRSWLCVSSTSEQHMRAVLGFDSVRPGVLRQSSEPGLLRMAFDAIANALGRDLLERDREQLQATLHQARRMETIGAFASGIAHNFNNIIGAILGYAETAQAHERGADKSIDSLTEIRRAGERARMLVDQILKFGRSRDGRASRICVDALVMEAKSLLDVSLGPNVKVLVHITSQGVIVSGEAAQLQQVILNICNNAAQAIDQSGCIRIEVGVEEVMQALRTPHGELKPGPHALISMTDAGRGMDRMTLERIFEPFFSTRAAGNGLGLATVREIVLQHRGVVKVFSAPGAGTRFDILLPCAPGTPPLATPRAGGLSDRGAGETVLVLDSDPGRLLRHEEILAALGYEPVGFTRVADAVNAYRSIPNRFDAALICCHLSDAGTMIERASALRTSAPALPLILATTSARELGVPSLAAAGISEIIRHPLRSAELAAALASCVVRK